VVLNGKSVLNFDYNILVHDGKVGLYARNGAASFDNVLIRGDDIAYAGGGTPLTVAAAPAQVTADAGNLDASALAAALAEAERRWIASGLVDAWTIASFGAIQVRVADLDGVTLGLSNDTQKSIIIDADAAGYGWFIDPTLSTDDEFGLRLNFDERAASLGSQAYGKIDLLTVVQHELGHLLGFEHGSIDLMGETLVAGVRISPAGATSAAAVPAEPGIVTRPTIDAPGLGTLPSGPGATVPTTDAKAATPKADLSALMALWPTTLPTTIVLAPDGGGKPTTSHDLEARSVDDESTGTAKLKIDWNRNRSSFAEKIAASSETRNWQDDFLNHLGKDGLQRNPNAGLRVRPGVFSG
jgi:hypothetical protein